jgi:hypothetical protein
VYLGPIVCACWVVYWLTPNHPRAAHSLWRAALVWVTLLACNAVLPL